MNLHTRPFPLRFFSASLFALAPLLALAVLLTAPAEVSAETVKARRTSNVYAKPGERSKVVTTVRSGKSMSVRSRKGRWLKVRANGRTGWIVRSNVVTKQARTNPKSNKRSKGFVKGRSGDRDLRRKSGPSDRLGLDATDDDDDESRSKKKKKKAKKKKAKKKKAKKKKKKVEEFDEFGDDDDDDDFGDDDDDDDGDDDFGDDDDDDVGDDDDDDDGETDEREVVVVALDVEIRSRRSKRADEVAFAAEGDRLFVLGRKGSWVEVETTDGDTGWVREKNLEEVDDDSDSSRKMSLKANAGLGLFVISQTFRSNSTEGNPFDDYKIGSRAVGIALGANLVHDYKKQYVIGGDLNISYALSPSGISVNNEAGMTRKTGYSLVDIGLIGKGGYKLHADTKTVAFARLGFRYSAMVISNVADIEGNNPAALPSEALKGPVVGIEIDSGKVIDKVSANLKIDTMMLLASRSQTGQLEDGDNSSARAFFFTLGGVYAYQPNLRILGSYQYGSASTSWNSTEANNTSRKHNATEADRSDRSHVISVGAVRDF